MKMACAQVDRAIVSSAIVQPAVFAAVVPRVDAVEVRSSLLSCHDVECSATCVLCCTGNVGRTFGM